MLDRLKLRAQSLQFTLLLAGTEGTTAYRKLHNPYKNQFERNEKDTYVIVDKPVGEFLCAKVLQCARPVDRGLRESPTWQTGK